MFERELRIETCSAMVLLTWGAALALLVLSGLLAQPQLANWGISCSGFGAALLVVKDNAKTRRVVRAMAREMPPAPIRSLRD